MTMNREEFKKESGIIGRTKEINDLADIAMQVSRSDISVLIYGESGTGKEVFARAIHNYSYRRNKQLVSVNCGAIPEGILESELFGHKKGSFTGATDTRKGYFEIADGGTLFLDEIAEMPLTTQVKLLRVLESKEFMKIGDETVTKVDVRIIAATNKDLKTEVEAKRFREDLYFRLKAVSLTLPPLRKRKSDIPELVEYIANNLHAVGKEDITISNDAYDLLMEYPWPGNIRELKNTIETAITLSRNGVLDRDSFIPLLNMPEPETKENRNLPVFLKKSPEDADRELLYRALFEIKKDLLDIKDLIYLKNEEEQAGRADKNDEIIPLAEVEKEAIKHALEKTRGSKRDAAKYLQISERTLYRKIKDYDLDY